MSEYLGQNGAENANLIGVAAVHAAAAANELWPVYDAAAEIAERVQAGVAANVVELVHGSSSERIEALRFLREAHGYADALGAVIDVLDEVYPYNPLLY